mmetsp:Transcript_20490/g.43563  ORF Transcript_20490/g.43563 Transcript_20490/m.43563 type:complete len:361 (-) Transcript_20490:61-1143(-)
MLALRLSILVAAFYVSDAARLSAGGESAEEAWLAEAGSSEKTDLCDKWLMVQYRGKPESEGEEPITGTFYLKEGEWTEVEIYRKIGKDGCVKTYVAKCALGAVEVSELCEGDKEPKIKTNCLGGWTCWSNSYVSANKKQDEIVVQPPSGGPVSLVAGVVTSGVVKSSAVNSGQCPPMTLQPNFDLNRYISKPWYIQQQMPTEYLPVEKNFCVEAKYTLLPTKSFWGYEIQVRNIARSAEGQLSDSGNLLLAYSADSMDPAKLGVAPYFVPKSAAGEYWVVAYDEEEGYAIVSGGQPTHKTAGGCTTGDGINDSGFWLFTRQRERNEATVQKMRAIAQAKGFDLAVLHDVDHSDCSMMPVL